MEVALIIAAAGGLLGCFGVVARVDVVRKRERLYKPLSRVPVRV